MPKRSYSMQRRVALEAETRERIVRATVALHAQHGALATTYAMIAKRAQVAPQTVYNHFPNDDALLGACTGHVHERAPRVDAEAIRSGGSPAARLSLLAQAVFARHEFMAPWLRWREAAAHPRAGRDRRRRPRGAYAPSSPPPSHRTTSPPQISSMQPSSFSIFLLGRH